MNSETLVPMAEVEVKDFHHVMLCFQYVGSRTLLNVIEGLNKEFPKMPGLGLAIAVAKAHVADDQARMLARNLSLACRHGFDPDTQTLTMAVRDKAVWLTAETVKEDSPSGDIG